MGPAEYPPVGCFRESAIKSILEAVAVSKKIIREEKLISVAHPDFRAELRADAAARYHV
ncbi:MAG: hypothetical protein IIB87_01010 [Chloroflexi bacterium]|nr:hypothetical protein [Chloroflexota bacterium]